jgi:hypothetical protein
MFLIFGTVPNLDTPCRKWRVLQSVQDRNETLFYRLLMDNFLDMVSSFSGLFSI